MRKIIKTFLVYLLITNISKSQSYGRANIDFTFAAEKTINSVVHIKVTRVSEQIIKYQNPFFNFLFQDDFFKLQPQRTSSIGSGVILSSDGYIITNNHVIFEANEIVVTLNDKRKYNAKVVGFDASTDIALIKIDEVSLPNITIGNSDSLKIGEWVLAVGNPFNLSSTVTAGIVSAKERNINLLTEKFGIESFIQTDAAVNPGNSGGALVNLEGKLVGINTAIQSQNGNYAGYSFAIPVNIVKKVYEDLKSSGKVQRAILGVNIIDITSELAKQKKINSLKGVYISGIIQDGAAETAGIRAGDIILSIELKEVNSIPELVEKIAQYRPGDIIKVLINRENVKKEFKVILKNEYNQLTYNSSNKNKDNELYQSKIGANLVSLTSDELSRLRITNGVKVKNISKNSIFDKINMLENFVITDINRKKVNEPQDVINALEEKNGSIFISGVNSDGSSDFYVINY